MTEHFSTLKHTGRIDKWLIIILLSFVGLTIFFTEPMDGGSIEGSIGSGISAHGMTLSKNLVNGDHFLFMFSKRELRNDKVVYDAYNRFPVFPFFLTGVLTYPFHENLSLQVYAARQIMNVFFFLTLLLVYKTIVLLIEKKYLALSMTLVIFSSYYLLSYNDLIFNDMPAFLGFVIALNAVVKSQKQSLKFSEILFLSVIPISFGWQPYAVFAAWTFVDTLELFKIKKLPLIIRIKKLKLQPSFKIFGIALIWGLLVLGIQLLNEWRIVGGSFWDLPSVISGLWRSGVTSAAGHTNLLWSFDWFTYLPGQFHSIILMLIPFWPIFQIEPGYNAPIVIVFIFVLFILIRFFSHQETYTKVILIMTLSGFFWSIPMKHFVALHDFQAIFYIGFVISIYSHLFRKLKIKPLSILAVNITLIFMISVTLTNHHKSPFLSGKVAVLQAISRQLPVNSRVYFDGNLNGQTRYIELLLSGCIFTKKDEADYVISKNLKLEKHKFISSPIQ